MLDWFRRLFTTPAPTSPAIPTASNTPDAPPPRKTYFADDGLTLMQRDQMDFMFAEWLFEAGGNADMFTNKTEDAVLQALREVVQSNEAGAHLLRRLPGVIPQLLQSLRNGDFAGPELARRISSDLVLVAEVLRLANSVAYKPGGAITSVEQAILVLGQDGLRQLITSVAFKPIIDLRSGSFTRMVAPRLWEQSERCAFANRMLARDADPLDAFLAGLIHNVGLTVSLRVIDRVAEGGLPVGSPTFCNAFASLGRSLAYNIGRDWHFPENVMNAIREQGGDKPYRALSPLGRVLFVGNYLSKMDILARRLQVGTDAARLTVGLAPHELECLQQLSLLEERDWLAAISIGGKETTGRA